MTLLAVLALGFFLGIRHATDADHVVAVATIVARERTMRSAISVGALWGLGHTLTILVVGGAIVAFGVVIPPRLGLSMELAVAMMLIVLGTMNMTGAMRHIEAVAHYARPVDGHAQHDHAHRMQSLHAVVRGRWLRPLVVGLVHGLAGSAAIALLVLATIRSVGSAMLYLGIFGAGTVVGMMFLTSAMAVPLAAGAAKSVTFETRLARLTGVVSIAFGLFLTYQIGIVDGLFGHSPTWVPQ